MQEQITKPDIGRAVRHLFSEEAYQTGITEYGICWEDLTSGQAVVPPQGARFDIAFEGKLSGYGINGQVKGIDYLEVRSDGKFMLNIYATILTDDGETIALREDGVLLTDTPGKAKLHLNMHFSTAAPGYLWLNTKQVWGVGEVNMSNGLINVQGYTD